MKWFWIPTVFYLVTQVKSWPTIGDGPPVPERTIKSMARNPGEKCTFTLSETTPEGTTHAILVIRNSTGQETTYNADVVPSDSFTFDDGLKDLSGQSGVSFTLTAADKDDEPLAFAYKDIQDFPKFPGTPTATRLTDPNDPTKTVISRVEGILGKFNLNKAGTLIAEDGNIHYYQEKTNPDYTPCTEEDSVTICDITFAPGEVIDTTTHDEILTSAILSYGSDNQAKVKLAAETPSGATQVYEAILMPPTKEDNALCTLDGASPIEKECPIQWSNPSKDTLQLIIIRKTTDTQSPETDSWTTSSVVIQDRKLMVNQLGDNIIEGRWLVLEGESTYRMKINDTKVVDIEVDCSHLSLDPKLCYGYFSKLTKDTYTLTVAYYKKDGTANEKEQIESSPVEIQQPESELGILSSHTKRHANQLMADVNICFEHLTPTEGRSFSHYEMLIINEKGQWLKHRILEEEEEEREGRLCFTPFAINTKDFDLTEGTRVIVSQRGVDGFTVLATGQSKLL